MVERIKFLFRKTWIAKLLWGRKRTQPSKFQKNKKEKKQLNSNFETLKDVLFNKTFTKIFIICFIFLILFVFVIHYRQYSQIQTQPLFPKDKHFIQPMADLEEYNVLFFVIDDTKPGYYFIDSISLINTNFNSAKANIYTINPNFTIETPEGTKSSIKSYINLYSASNEDKTLYLMNSIEELLGLRVDRYIAITVEDLKEYINYENISVTPEASISLKEKEFKAKEKINKKELNQILFDVSLRDENNDQISLLYNYFVKEVLSNHFSSLDLYKYFWNSEKLTSSFKTDMNKKEFITFITNLKDIKKPVKTEYLSTNLGLKVKESIEELYTPNFTLIDESISSLISNINLIAEQAEVEVYNSTSIPGLASKKRRELQNLGISIVKYGNYFQPIEKNTLYVIGEDIEPFKNTIESINRLFRGNLDIKVGEYEDNYTGDLILILGK